MQDRTNWMHNQVMEYHQINTGRKRANSQDDSVIQHHRISPEAATASMMLVPFSMSPHIESNVAQDTNNLNSNSGLGYPPSAINSPIEEEMKQQFDGLPSVHQINDFEVTGFNPQQRHSMSFGPSGTVNFFALPQA